MIEAHKIVGIPFHASPNVGGVMRNSPCAIVIHYSGSESLSQTVGWLCDSRAKASAHIIIGENGDIVQLVPLNHIAWHAGKSTFQGKSQFNQFSIGIELINPGRLTRIGDIYCAWFGKEYPYNRVVQAKHRNEKQTVYWCSYTQKQLESLNQLILLLFAYYPINLIVGHDEISPDRKVDPGPAFPMEELRERFLHAGRDDSDLRAASNQPSQGKVNISQLNIRSNIAGEPRKGPLVRGQPFTILDEQGGWYRIKVEEIGWVKKEYVTVIDGFHSDVTS